MTQEETNKELSETPPSEQDITPPRPWQPVSVAVCKLELKNVRLRRLVCMLGDAQETIPPAKVECRGSLVEESLLESGFHADVTWTLDFHTDQSSPISIIGTHRLAFSVVRRITKEDAEYYSETNAAILVYPYIRQIVDDLTSKSLGRSIIIPPLDVPKWIKAVANKRREKENVTEGGSDAKPAVENGSG